MNTHRIEQTIARHTEGAAAAFVRSLIERDIDRAIAATYSGAAR